MPLDFPAAPTTGQIFAAGSSSWRFDGVKWNEMTGALAIPDAPSDGNTYGRRNAAWNSVDAMLAPVVAAANNDVGRNLLHNPVYTIAQRGAGPWTTNSVYTLDRWFLGVTSDAVSISQSALTDSARTAIGDETAAFALTNVYTGNSAAGAVSYIEQRIENVRRLAAKTVTLSFWAAANAAGLKLGINAFQLFGTGGSPSSFVQVLATGNAIALSTSWTRYTATFTLPSIVGKTLGTNNDHYTIVRFYYSSGANNALASGNIGVQSGTIQLWGTQLEYGSVATPLDYGGSPADQLRQCQRFFEVFNIPNDYTSSLSATAIYRAYGFTTTKRAVPTVTFTNFQYYSANVNTPFTATQGNINPNGVTAVGGSLTAAQGFFTGTITASADL